MTLGGSNLTDDRYLVVNPFFHSFGYKIGIVVGLLTWGAFAWLGVRYTFASAH